MKMLKNEIRRFSFIFYVFFLVVSGCKKETIIKETVINDKLLRIEVGRNGISSLDTSWIMSEFPTYNLPDFNKNDYKNVDSIIFVPSMYSDTSINKCIVELFNITDSVSIKNTIVESNSSDWGFRYSKNIYDALPDKRIFLGMRIKSEHKDFYVSTGIVSYIYIYRH